MIPEETGDLAANGAGNSARLASVAENVVFVSLRPAGERASVRDAYFAAVMDFTCMVFPSRAPVTVTFCAANFSGVF